MKSGEEFRELFTSPNALFIGICEGWVKSEEYSLNIFHQNIPNGDDVADTTCQYKEMEHGMHVFLLVDTVEHSTRDVSNTFCNNPPDCGWGNRIDKRLEGNEN